MIFNILSEDFISSLLRIATCNEAKLKILNNTLFKSLSDGSKKNMILHPTEGLVKSLFYVKSLFLPSFVSYSYRASVHFLFL